MNVTRQEAAEALSEIGKAGGKVVQLKQYHHTAPHFILWGLVWLVGNSVTGLWPEQAGLAWAIVVPAGMIGSFLLGFLSYRREQRPAQPDGAKHYAVRFVLLGLAFSAFFSSIFYFNPPDSAMQASAVVSIFFAFLYIGFGLWFGWRLFAVGVVTAALIAAGYTWLPEYFYLWMGVVSGGSLILGGLWLRSA